MAGHKTTHNQLQRYQIIDKLFPGLFAIISTLAFALQMGFIKLELSALGYSVGTVNWNVVSPQVLFGWKYEIGSFEPFIKLGAGINFNAAKHKTVLILSGRFNMNTTSISYDGDTLFDKFGCGTKSLVIGFKYSK